MEEKTKFIIIIALAGILGISLFINLKTYSAKKAIEQELGYTKTENESLTKKIEEGRRDNKLLEERVNALTSDLGKISQEKQELQKQAEDMQKQYSQIAQERGALIEKLKREPQIEAGNKEGQKGSGLTVEEAYWAGILKTKTELETQLKVMQAENKQLKTTRKILEATLNNLTHEKQDLEQQLQSHKKIVDDMNAEFIRLKNERFQLQDKLAGIENESGALRQQLSSLSTSNEKIQKKLEQLSQEKLNLERKLTDMELFLQENSSGMKEAKQQLDTIGSKETPQMPQARKESIELPPIVVRPKAETSGIGPSQKEESLLVEEKGAQVYAGGAVVGVNKENNFVVIDLGVDAGIKAGKTLHVYRQGQIIADIEVVQIRKNISACDIKKETTAIQVGDKVR